MHIAQIADELIDIYNNVVEGTRVTGSILAKSRLFYDFVKIEGGEDSTRITIYEDDNVIHLTMLCFIYRSDNAFSCSNPDCAICSFKDLDFAGGIAKTHIYGQYYIPNFLKSLQFPIDIHVLGANGYPTIYGGVRAIQLLQYGFRLDCRSVNPIERRENYAIKANVEEIWVKPISLCMVKMYINVKRVNVISPKFEIVAC